MIPSFLRLCLTSLFATAASAAMAQNTIDNQALSQAQFREHKTTYGLVYRLPQEANATLDAKIMPKVKAALLKDGLATEANTPNIPHVTVVHIHNADPQTPARMLKVLPKPPAPLKTQLVKFYTTEAAKDAGHPWWLDLGVAKEGPGFEAMMAYNTQATAALTPLRDGPLPRVTGPVYAKMGEAGRKLVAEQGVSGVNVVSNGQELRTHNPHTTLVYSMTPYAQHKTAMDVLTQELNAVLPEGIPTTFKDVSIVEIGFAGNVLREIYRISLEDGSVLDVASGKPVVRN
ncbi:hypothetical protein ACLQ9F_01910 [Bordetella avium]|uniref:hypothetical protein n=1 Tax=Bordetella avium TaxID=521 RepID=UPI0039FD014D